ncbi:dTMP kinase [Allocatelliglobosispora scoriae]|uniref:Thymidylate kinase n=1 Tax=Allocatelliglobosispora scoriae TaxID=643052 RepID=A0A841C3K6_9ACTN|nr:dTMP kinase [Allocatelliglobosispora scoriae]MBB5873899.1 dTMP kinase [Allocatelliglobosispora scoriae]
MAHPVIIALVGIDGSGKSSQARELAAWLTMIGTPAISFKAPGGRLKVDRIARRLRRSDGIDLLGRILFAFVEATVRWLAIARALLVSRLTGRTLVMDRYTYCQFAVMAARGDRGRRLTRFFYALFPTPDLVCFLAVDPVRAKRRIEARGYDTEPLDYLRAFDASYRALPEFAGFTVIDADGTEAEVEAALHTHAAELRREGRARRAGLSF